MKIQSDKQLDDWQEEVMRTEGNMCLRSGRQVGKSFIIGKKAANYALNNPNKLIMVIAYTEKQANLLFSKILNNIVDMEKEDKKKYIAKPKPTKHIINLTNKSTIHCYAAGDTGFGIMGFTIDLLIADEAAWIKEEVWNSIIPALAITKGNIWLLSTPWLSEGYYFDCFSDESFTSFHQSAEDCPRRDEEFLERQRKKLTKARYAQMYLGEFVDDAYRIFGDKWIDKVCCLQIENYDPKQPDNEAIGIDVAGTGEDESTYEGLVREGNNVRQFYHQVVEKSSEMWFTEMMINIRHLNKLYDAKFGIDGDGLGSGVVSSSMSDDDLKRKVIDLKNSRREVDGNGKMTSRSMKEAMYMNMLEMGELGELKLFDCAEIRLSLRSIISQKLEGGGEKIDGNYSHIVEGLIRSAWLLKEKDINMQIYSIKV
jgi:hypothetical protein|tara:strand:+ start:241 stop:1518 length:1278 start_codon:yes stop_codon:yes gene_type:complete